MPDQFGNPTPSEVMGQIVSERNAAVASAQTPQQRRIAQLSAIGQTVFAGFDPRLVHAKEISQALENSLSIEQFEGEDQLDYEIRQARAAFQEMRNVDPATAAEISSKLTELEAERLERSFLQQSRDLEIEADTEALETARQQNYLDGLQYALDPRTGQLTSDFVNMHDPNATDRVNQLLEQGLVLIPADDVVGMADTSAADFSLFNNSSFDAQLEMIDTQIRNVSVATQLAEVFQAALAEGDNPAAFLDGLERRLGGAMEAIDDAKGLFGAERPVPGTLEWDRDISAAEDWIRREGIRSGVTASLLTTLAYTRARTFDNRVTDQDFRKAYDMLGADSGDPSIIMSNMRSIVFGDSMPLFRTVRNKMEAADAHIGPTGKGRAQIATISSQLDLLQEFVDDFDGRSSSILEMFGVGDATTGGNRPASAQSVTSGGRTFTIRGRQP